MPTITTRVAESQDGGMSASMKLIKETIPNENEDVERERRKVQIKNATKQGYLNAEVGDGIDISTRMHHHRGNVQKGKTQTITCSGGDDRGVVVEDEQDYH